MIVWWLMRSYSSIVNIGKFMKPIKGDKFRQISTGFPCVFTGEISFESPPILDLWVKLADESVLLIPYNDLLPDSSKCS